MTAGRLLMLAVVVLVVVSGGAAAFQPPPQIDIETDSVSLHADVRADGDADWSVTYRIRLDDGNTTEAFESLQADIASDPAPYLDPFRQRMERTAAGAENATGREMAIRNVTVETRRESQPQVEYGVVTYRLEWTNFAAVDDGTVRAGDAVDQLFLDPGTSLRMTAPDGYAVGSTTPEPTRTATSEVVWQGQRGFDPGEPRVVFVPEEGTPNGTVAGGSGDSTGSPTETGTTAAGDGFPVVPLVVVILLVLGGAWVASRGDISLPSSDGETDAGGDKPPPELLSNEERVLRLLERNGGRMKQKEVAAELDWTAAKTSQVVGTLRDDGKVDSFRLGRENVLTLPDVEIDATSEDADRENDR